MSTTQSVSEANKRRHTRLPLHLNVMLVRDGHRPRGCRVINVSESGMFLRWSSASMADNNTRTDTFRVNEKVEIRFSYRSPLGRKDISLPATVRRAEEDGIGIAFDEKDQAINELISHHLETADMSADPNERVTEPDLSDSPIGLEVSFPEATADNDETLGEDDASALLSTLDSDLDQAMDEVAIARSAGYDTSSDTTTASDVEQIEEDLLARLPVQDYAHTHRLERRILTVGLLTFFFGLASLISTGAYLHSTKTQILDLRTALGKAMEQIEAVPQSMPQNPLDDSIRTSLADLTVQLHQVSEDLSRIEQKVDETPVVTVALPSTTLEPTSAVTAVPAAPEQKTTVNEALRDTFTAETTATPPKGTTVAEPAISASPAADEVSHRDPVAHEETAASETWVINLVALRNKEAADRLAEKAESFGIPVNMQNKGTDEKPLYQLRVVGLNSITEAETYAKEVEAKLDLNGTTVNRAE